MNQHSIARFAALGFLFATFATSSRVLAQADDTERRSAAQALFDDAQHLLEQKKFAEACPKLDEVVKLQPGKVGAMLTLARCYESAGKVASAWTRYKQVVDRATAVGDPRLAEAQGKVESLAPRVPKLILGIADANRGAPGLVVARDGLEVGSALLGVAVPVDAGVHEVRASAQGKKPWTNQVTLAEGATITVNVPVLETLPAPAPAAGDVSPAHTSSNGRRTAGFVLGGLGIAGLAVGAITGGIASSKHSTLGTECPNSVCTSDHHDEVVSYNSFGVASTVGFIAGGALLATGVVVLLSAPSSNKTADHVSLSIGPSSFALRGSFQ